MAKTQSSNFHSTRLSEQKVANMMLDTFSKLKKNQMVSGGPSKYASFKTRSNTIAYATMFSQADSEVNMQLTND